MAFIIKKLVAMTMFLILLPSAITGASIPVISPQRFDISIDSTTKEILDTIKAESDFDIESVVTNLPDLTVPSNIAKNVLHLDTASFSERLIEKADEFSAEGNGASIVYFMLGQYLRVFKKCDITFEQVTDEREPVIEELIGEYEFVLNVTFDDGSTERFYTGAFYNPETKEFHGEDDKGICTIGFNFDIEDMVVYATVNSWMRSFGFCVEYDLFCYTTPIFFYNTRRFKFDYDGREWMIQAWKGNYLISNGAEVGLYNREAGSIGSFYNCANDDEMLEMTMELYHGDELILERGPQNHWWINGFRLSRELYPAKELTLKTSIVMKDEEMVRAFTGAIDKNAFKDVEYKVDGLTVTFTW